MSNMVHVVFGVCLHASSKWMQMVIVFVDDSNRTPNRLNASCARVCGCDDYTVFHEIFGCS